jgi:predicted nucleic acid-binding protein
MIVADSSVWIDALRNVDVPSTRFLKALQVENDLIIGDLIALEVLQGILDERKALALEKHFTEYGIVPMLDQEVALAAARNYRALRRKGVTVKKTPDLIIASFCLLHDHQLLHADRDFDHFEALLGLKVFRPT